MEPSEILRWLAEALERLQIPYLVTGSMATIAYGEPRFTNDIDVVVALRLDQVDAFCARRSRSRIFIAIESQSSRQSSSGFSSTSSILSQD